MPVSPMASFGSVRDATSGEGNGAVLDSGWATARVAPTRASSPSCCLRRLHACRRPRLSSPPCLSSPMPVFPMASFGSARDATRAWDATSGEGNGAVLDSGWATARVAPTRASSPSCSCRGDACRRPHAGFPDGLVRVGRDATSGEGNGAVLDSGWATARVAPTRASSPSCSCRGDACRRPCRFPRWPRSGRDATSGEGNGAVLDSGWATARVAPTRASSPSCSCRGDACRRPHAGFPDGLVRVGRDATSGEGNGAVLDSGWATARPLGAIGSWDGRPQGSPLPGGRHLQVLDALRIGVLQQPRQRSVGE